MKNIALYFLRALFTGGIMAINRKLIFMLLLSSTSLSPAATEFETTVPVTLVRYLSGGVAYRDLPDNFPPFVLPEGMQLLGSQDSSLQQFVLLRTNRGGAESQAAIVEALMAEGGWLTLAPVGSQRQNGFVVPAGAGTLRPVSLCHDEFGELEIRGEDGIENRVYMRRMNRALQEGWPGCAVLNETRLQGRPAGLRELRTPTPQYMPSFEFLIEDTSSRPEAFVTTEREIGIRGFSPSRAPVGRNQAFLSLVPSIRNSSGLITKSELRIPANGRSADDINDLVIKQLREEGWELDTRWQGDAGAGSNWVRTTETDMKLLLSFMVMATGIEDYEARIKLTELEQSD